MRENNFLQLLGLLNWRGALIGDLCVRLRILVCFCKVLERNCLEDVHKFFVVCIRLYSMLLNFEEAHVFLARVLNVSDKVMCE